MLRLAIKKPSNRLTTAGPSKKAGYCSKIIQALQLGSWLTKSQTIINNWLKLIVFDRSLSDISAIFVRTLTTDQMILSTITTSNVTKLHKGSHAMNQQESPAATILRNVQEAYHNRFVKYYCVINRSKSSLPKLTLRLWIVKWYARGWLKVMASEQKISWWINWNVTTRHKETKQ